jgi:hypothetical protein
MYLQVFFMFQHLCTWYRIPLLKALEVFCLKPYSAFNAFYLQSERCPIQLWNFIFHLSFRNTVCVQTYEYIYYSTNVFFHDDSRNNFERIVNIPEDDLSSFVPELELEFCGEEGGGDIILSFKDLVTEYFRRLKVVHLLFC